MYGVTVPGGDEMSEGCPEVGEPEVGEPEVGEPEVGEPEVGEPEVEVPGELYPRPDMFPVIPARSPAGMLLT
jgi:hypothetical protein